MSLSFFMCVFRNIQYLPEYKLHIETRFELSFLLGCDLYSGATYTPANTVVILHKKQFNKGTMLVHLFSDFLNTC